jgi:hypothetical protein
MQCPLVQTYLNGIAFSSDPTAYVSVWGPDTVSNPQTKFIHDFIFEITNVGIDDSKSCPKTACDVSLNVQLFQHFSWLLIDWL